MDQQAPGPDFATVGVVTGDQLSVTVRGEVDMATADAMFDAATRENPGSLRLDLRSVTFFDSAAIHALVQIADRYPGRLEVMPSAQVRRVLEISGLATQPWLKG